MAGEFADRHQHGSFSTLLPMMLRIWGSNRSDNHDVMMAKKP